MNVFAPAMDGRDRHTSLIVLLVLLTLLPAACVLWFMNEAVGVQDEASRRAALEEVPLELSTPVAGVAVSAPAARELLQGLTPEVHRRAAIKRALVGLWRTRLGGDWSAECPEGRWERLAWLAFVGYALPPVFPDQRRWEARSTLGTELQGSGLELGQVRATLEVARKLVLAEAGNRPGRTVHAQ